MVFYLDLPFGCCIASMKGSWEKALGSVTATKKFCDSRLSKCPNTRDTPKKKLWVSHLNNISTSPSRRWSIPKGCQIGGTKKLSHLPGLGLQVAAHHLGHVASCTSSLLVSHQPLIGTVASKNQLLGQHIDEGRIWNPPVVESPVSLHMLHKVGPSTGDGNGGWNSICHRPLHHRLQFPTIASREDWDACT